MWNLLVRLGMVLSTLVVSKEFIESLLPVEIRPMRLYRPHQIASYLGTTPEHVLELIHTGSLSARWVGGSPVILGASILEFLSRAPTVGPDADIVER